MAYHIVIDTNVIIAALRSKQGASHLLLRLLGTSDWQAHISIPLVLEYEEVCHRLLSSLGVSHEQINDFFGIEKFAKQALTPKEFLQKTGDLP